MILLQSSLNTLFKYLHISGNDTWYYVEIVIIILIITMQFLTFINVRRRINELRHIFDYKFTMKYGFIEKSKLGKIEDFSKEIKYVNEKEEKSLSERKGDDITKLTLVETEGKNEIITKIKNHINIYLINNYGAVVNFSIIKDIIDREVEVKDEEITQSITTPIYLGLAATMTGIILGLFSMPPLAGKGFLIGTNALINGVKIAMISSLSGLFFTTLLSSRFYKNAKSKVLKEKSDQLSYLQAKLLPELIRAEDTGVSGLKASLDKFARVGTKIFDEVLIAANQTGKNLALQQEVMDKVENMEILKVSKWNLELFEKLDVNMNAINKFSTYLSNMEKISSSLLEFAKRTSNIDRIAKEIGTTLKDSNQLTQFLSAHFDEIKNAGDAALKSVGLAESHFEDAIVSLKTRTDEMINQLYKSAGNNESKLEDIYKEINANLNNITSEYINSFSEAYSNSIPRFEQLDNLGLLPEIKEGFLLKATDFQNESDLKTKKLIEKVTELSTTLKSLQNILNNQAILSKLDSIDGKLKRKSNKNTIHNNPPTNTNGKTDNEKLENNSLHIGTVIKELFKK